jgi:hypothetical protein
MHQDMHACMHMHAYLDACIAAAAAALSLHDCMMRDRPNGDLPLAVSRCMLWLMTEESECFDLLASEQVPC